MLACIQSNASQECKVNFGGTPFRFPPPNPALFSVPAGEDASAYTLQRRPVELPQWCANEEDEGERQQHQEKMQEEEEEEEAASCMTIAEFDGWVPLQWPCYRFRKDSLLHSLNHMHLRGWTPLHFAAFLGTYQSNYTALHFLCLTTIYM